MTVLNSPRLSKKESNKIKPFLTEDAIKKIAMKKKVSERMVKYIRDGVFGDRHGVIDCLIQAAKVRKGLLERKKFLDN